MTLPTAAATRMRIEEILGRRSGLVERISADVWTVGDRDGQTRARLVQNWVELENTETLPSANRWRLLCAGAAIRGPGKLCLAGGELRARAELGAFEDDTLEDRLTEAIASVSSARDLALDRGRPSAPPGGEAPAIEELVAEIDFEHHEREDGRVVVDLDVPDAFHQATLEPLGTGVRLSAEIARFERLTPLGAEALAEMMLASNGTVRQLRGVGIEENAESSLRFEVNFESAPSSTELDHALGALGLACARWGRETKALSDEALARTYLAIRG